MGAKEEQQETESDHRKTTWTQNSGESSFKGSWHFSYSGSLTFPGKTDGRAGWWAAKEMEGISERFGQQPE